MKPETVFVVDDDAAVRDGLAMLFESDGLAVETYADGESFLAAFDPARSGCLVLDLRMPGMSGPHLQRELRRRHVRIPIVFLTAHGDIPTTVEAIKSGAIDFLTKPAEPRQLLERVRTALARDRDERAGDRQREGARAALETLTERERDVLLLAVSGLSNKLIARRLGISHRTVEVHRSRVLLKTGASSLLDLARFAKDAGLDVATEKLSPA